MGDPDHAAEVTRHYLDIWNNRLYEDIPDVVSDSFIMYDPVAPEDDATGPKWEVHGPDGLEVFIKEVTAGFPDFHVEIIDLIAGNDIAMYEGIITLTHNGYYYWIPPTNQHAVFRYMGTTRLSGNMIDEHRVYFDMQRVVEQLGFAFPSVLRHLPKIGWAKIKHITPGR